MSHYTVLVIGQDPEKRLAPFHEFECTGTNDEYVLNVDILGEALAEFEGRTEKMVKTAPGAVFAGNVKAISHPEHGTLISKWEKCFWQDPTDGSREKTFALPDGYEEITVPAKELQTFESFIIEYHDRARLEPGQEPDIEGEHKYGWYRVNEAGEVIEMIRRTNPNKKWDWYTLGGRWTGFFKMKPNVKGIKGSPGLMTPEATEGTADSAFKGDIDFDTMRAEAEAEAAVTYDRIRAVIEPHLPFTPWDQVRAKYTGDTPELEGGIQAARKALNESKDNHRYNVEDFLIDRDTYIRNAGIQSTMTFAVLKDGQWYERGSMGWWGMVANEKENDVWTEEFGKLVESLPDDTLLSVYDCHI